MTTRRQRRVSELLHRELSTLLMLEVRDPRVATVTITGVDITPDLMLARVHFTVFGGADEQREALLGLQHAAGFLRSQLASRIRLRSVPEMVFLVDRSAEHGRRIDELLDQLAVGGSSPDEPPSG